jgi:hypothetical protein
VLIREVITEWIRLDNQLSPSTSQQQLVPDLEPICILDSDQAAIPDSSRPEVGVGRKSTSVQMLLEGDRLAWVSLDLIFRFCKMGLYKLSVPSCFPCS